MTQDVDEGQQRINQENASFWDELCGSTLATRLGITDDSPQSLKKFDDWYFDFYPYLFTHIPFKALKGQKVLEVGLGYGTVSQEIAQAEADYTGLDIAAGPVAMVNHRIKQKGLKGKAVQGSILEPPFDEGSFDWVVAIGCLHHTGDLAQAIQSVHALLRPGGQAMIMVYSASSYRQFLTSPVATVKRLMSSPQSAELIGKTDGDQKSRGSYDTDGDGEAAPQTEFVTKKELALMCRDFSGCQITGENIGTRGFVPRRAVLKFGKIIGLDLYCQLKK
ncbi:MAG: class I SAM-dependent methyltransferase [Hyphomicrobiaceae bacterium]|nr:class I SAM-dependent methyltransferase [Hyphomicrobiaceae bacterium]